jgi:hypothetical protein
MPASDFYECMLFDRMEPFGDPRGDIQAGVVASVIANVHRGPNRKAFEVADFLPFADRPKQSGQTPEQMHAAFLMFKTRYEKSRTD